MELDRFRVELDSSYWIFTVALGLGVGVVLSGLFVLFTNNGDGQRRIGAALTAGGLLIFLGVAVSPVDALPVNFVPLRLKPYASQAALSFALDLAFALGVALALLPLISLRWINMAASSSRTRSAFRGSKKTAVADSLTGRLICALH